MLIFIDTEFTNFLDPRLISVGAVAENGEEVYLELKDYNRNACSGFVKDIVLPGLTKKLEHQTNRVRVYRDFSNWVESLQTDRVTFIADADEDFYLIDPALQLIRGKNVTLGHYPFFLMDAITARVGSRKEAFQLISDTRGKVKEEHFSLDGEVEHNALCDARCLKKQVERVNP